MFTSVLLKMGGVIAGMSSAVALPLASCLGSCLGTCCCRLLQLGSIRPDQCKFFFLALQIWTLLCAFFWSHVVATLTTSETSTAWVFKKYLDFTGVGLVELRKNDAWASSETQIALQNDVTYKVTLTTEFFLFFGVLLSIAGSGSEALLRFWMLKFALPVLLPPLAFVALPPVPMWVCVLFGGSFLLLQMALVYGSGFRVQDWLRDKQVEDQYGSGMMDEGEKWYKITLLCR